MLILPRVSPCVTGYGDPSRGTGGGGNGGESDFDPTSIGTGCVCWLQPDAATMYQENTAVTPVASDGDTVGAWLDQSVVGGIAEQATASQRPLYKPNIQNSLPMVQFDGTDDWLLIDWLSNLMNGSDGIATVLLVFKKVSNTLQDALFAWANASGSNPLCDIRTNGSAYGLIKRDTAGTIVQPQGGTADTTDAHMMMARINGTTVDLWVDTTQILTGSAFDVGLTAITRAAVGASPRSIVTVFADAYIGEVVVWDNALSDADAQTAREQILSKWGLS